MVIMDPLGFTVATLGLVENLGKLIKLYDNQLVIDHLDDVLGELLILQSVLAESMVMMGDFLREPPASAQIALGRCQRLEIDLEQILSRLNSDGSKLSRMKRSIRLMGLEEKLRRVCDSFKSAVLLFRDIATE